MVQRAGGQDEQREQAQQVSIIPAKHVYLQVSHQNNSLFKQKATKSSGSVQWCYQVYLSILFIWKK